ncbi:MAG: sugar transferase [Aggregatilineales bacterium]
MIDTVSASTTQQAVSDLPENNKHIAYLNSRRRRLMDIVGAVIGLTLGAPIMLIASLVIKFVDRVPVIFTQERYGHHGKTFTILKLRTLPVIETYRIIDDDNVDTERIQKKPQYVTTRTGAWLRRHSIDEMPQFWLVLKGEMSLIGHRPFPVYYVPHLKELDGIDAGYVDDYLRVIRQYRPGMTSLSSINGRSNLTMQQKMAYDMHYAESASLWGDCKILLRTLVVLITCEGAR